MMTEEEIDRRALRVWGKQAQMLQVVEEMSELSKEIIKNVSRNKDNVPELIEEAADVEITLAQLKMCYGISQQVEEYKKKKLQVLAARVVEWEHKLGIEEAK